MLKSQKTKIFILLLTLLALAPGALHGTAAAAAPAARLLEITLDGKESVTAELLSTPAADAFAAMLPLRLSMTDYLNREKHAPSPGTIAEASLKNIGVEYKVGDIIYYPPGPTIAMFYNHDGRTISAGMEVVARLSREGIAALAARPGTVEMTVKLAGPAKAAAPAARQNGRRLRITLDGKQSITAVAADTPAAAEFLSRLPMTLNMTEHLKRQKEVYLPFSLSEKNLQNPRYEYEIGDIVYWHPGPTMGIFHSHDGRKINAGVELLAKLDDKDVKTLASYPDAVRVSFELAK